jgi:hypothetical protein
MEFCHDELVVDPGRIDKVMVYGVWTVEDGLEPFGCVAPNCAWVRASFSLVVAVQFNTCCKSGGMETNRAVRHRVLLGVQSLQ